MASTSICPKGHASEDDDFCSECGARIQRESTAPSMASAPMDATAAKLCPDCKAPAGAVNFCEICGYNFVSGTGGQIPSPPTTAPTPPAAVPGPVALKLVVSVDATLRTATSPEVPMDANPITYNLDKPVYMIGRTSSARAIFPELPLDLDTAVSHRHGIISQTAGGLIYRDLGSANGSRLNGADVPSLVDTPLKAGDQLTMGHWTRISIEPGT